MALDFPASPTNGQTFNNYTYDSAAGAWRSSALYSMGLPIGGTADQFLTKIDGTNYNTQWSTTLPVANGGTGAATLTSGAYLKGAGAAAVTAQTGIPAGDITSGTLSSARLSSGTVLQTLGVTQTGQTSTASGSPVDIAGLTVTITPRSASSKFLLTGMVNSGYSNSTGGWVYWNFARSGTNLVFSSGSTANIFANTRHVDQNNMLTEVIQYLDSPATASAITYTLRWSTYAGHTAYLNRRFVDLYFAGSSTFTVMEIA